ncbi:hypothetical protein [Candidatus Poriferisodalis multihospitum]|uniref:hypothetical protein n=1 Tax=Candidatus Poriferisodalis TaxID=2983190 RepID=UPI0013819C59|nr:hypothetical protein [Candidatus Poriferisodalis multihospitum]MCY3584559.1 hypothetical protein [Acidimicrobiaceae bacterium]MXV87248.1 hypothetical protein [Acidimicrobiales bacterium]MCY3607265.1 hypothetical protein [Acidimicrobiaceae bacterium]MCY3894034.1 hypothetical protein [Acidimicrobiaceae bacterium]MCY3949677.1 hypothetical protein [Acidimicrobiaceae bacterium]
MHQVLLLVENIVLLLCGLVLGWIAVTFLPGSVLPVIAVTVVLAAGGRLLFNGTFWTAGIGFLVAGIAGAGFYIADAVTSLGG